MSYVTQVLSAGNLSKGMTENAAGVLKNMSSNDNEPKDKETEVITDMLTNIKNLTLFECF